MGSNREKQLPPGGRGVAGTDCLRGRGIRAGRGDHGVWADAALLAVPFHYILFVCLLTY